MDRRSNGTFLPGHPGGPGRPRREVERRYLAVLSEEVTPEKWQQIVRVAAADALAGDARAREWLGLYLVGKPIERVELSQAEPDQFAEFAHLSVEELRIIAYGAPDEWPKYAQQTPEQLRAAHGAADEDNSE